MMPTRRLEASPFFAELASDEVEFTLGVSLPIKPLSMHSIHSVAKMLAADNWSASAFVCFFKPICWPCQWGYLTAELGLLNSPQG